jgi:hypothetical protein
MDKNQFDNISKELSNLKESSNAKLEEVMDLLAYEFETLKVDIIDKTYLLDAIEDLYNKFLNEYNSRK